MKTILNIQNTEHSCHMVT